MEERISIQKVESQQSIKINQGMNGKLGFEVKIYGENTNTIIEDLKKTMDKLNEEFVGK